jgi:hypothetical protein
MQSEKSERATPLFPYVGDVEISFPTMQLAEYACRVLEVDPELGDRVRRSFTLDLREEEEEKEKEEEERAILKVYVLHFSIE